jgi:hypothetical protein
VTNIQILTIVIALATSFLAVLTGVLLNNTRLNDVKEVLAAKAAAGDTDLRLQFERNRAELNAGVADLRVLIEKNHSEMLLKLVDIDNRLTRIENERRIVQ